MWNVASEVCAIDLKYNRAGLVIITCGGLKAPCHSHYCVLLQFGQTALSIAVDRRHWEVVKLLITSGAKVDTSEVSVKVTI